ncbi:MAG TPA: hypothetical protein VLG50_02655 [Candidatus Saccharimonadales bacterium]|nr:hypothetical protein [Candidatus Saccharimonadales bacterium]
MKSFACKHFIKFLVVSCFFFNIVLSSEVKKDSYSKIQLQKADLTATFGGRYVLEMFGTQNSTFLNAAIPNDCGSYLRTTIDYNIDILYGDMMRPRICFHDTIRSRYKWGTETDARTVASTTTVADATVPVRSVHMNKHLIWSREAWVRFALGNLDYPNNNFIQVGLIGFEVGRGISLGAAYTVTGFLGFSPGDSIEQYAPAVLLSFNPLVEKCTVDFYTAILENHNHSFRQNNAPIHKNEIGACPQRGPSTQDYIVAIRSKSKLINGAKHKLFVEPYIVVQNGTDQDLELEINNDVNTYLTTYGFAAEAVHGRFNCGMDAGVNTGQHDIKPIDRNLLKIVKNDDGILVEQFTKVYSSDPAIPGAKLAVATAENTKIVNGSDKNPGLNGQEIAGSTLFNAFDRFRPRQRQILQGYFFVADASYQFVEKVLTGSVGVGYASGYIDPQRDTNKSTQEQLMNEKFTAFIPLQSVYQGTRLKHLIIFNLGIPRFNVLNPAGVFDRQNLTPYTTPDSVDEMTNIAFAGINVNWNVEAWKQYKFNISPNVIAYWAPETASFVISKKEDKIVRLDHSDHFLGTELTAEMSAWFYEKLKVYAYGGIFIPGQHYCDMCGTLVGTAKQPTGRSVAYLINIGMSHLF